MLKTRDEAIRDIADRAADQCEALANQMTAVIYGEDDDGENMAERLCGISLDKEGRAVLLFAEPGVTNARTVQYVDCILALAKLLNSEHQVEYEV